MSNEEAIDDLRRYSGNSSYKIERCVFCQHLRRLKVFDRSKKEWQYFWNCIALAYDDIKGFTLLIADPYMEHCEMYEELKR